MQEVEQITKLLVGLAIRLNRVEKLLESKKTSRGNERVSPLPPKRLVPPLSV